MNDVLYGTTENGGTGGGGTVYQFSISTSVLSTIYNFTGGTDGGNPQAGVTGTGHDFYGTTTKGGSGGGTVFMVTSSG